MLGGRLERRTHASGGFTDLLHDGIVCELKVVGDKAVTLETADLHVGQPTQYASAVSAQLNASDPSGLLSMPNNDLEGACDETCKDPLPPDVGTAPKSIFTSVSGTDSSPTGSWIFVPAANGPWILFAKKTEEGATKREGGVKAAPRELPGFPDAQPAKPKTPRDGGGLRKRKDAEGRIYEWDYQHGLVEIYNRTGRTHLGDFDPDTGQQVGVPKV